MKLTRTFIVILSTTLLLAACSKEPEEALTVKADANPLLAYVPADTAYVFADLEPVPEAITDAYIDRFQPVLDVVSKQIKEFQADYQAGEHQDEPLALLASAVLDELGGTLNKESIENLGISIQAHHAVYAAGVFPVIRISLDDPEKLRSAISRIESKTGFKLPVKELDGTAYWRVSDDNMPVGIYLAIFDQQLAFSVFPVNAEDHFLAAFLGKQMPAQSMASSNALAVMNDKKGYMGYGSGIMDMQKLADEILNPDSETRGIMGEKMNAQIAALDPVCVAELKSMIAKAPRMTAGITRLTSNELGQRVDLEIENSLASSLAALVAEIPAAGKGDNLFSASLAIRVGKLRSFLLEKATALNANPYQCAKLHQFNEQAAELMTQLNIPMPPMINNLLGVRVEVEDFDPAKDMSQGNGLAAIHVDKPEMFVGMASMLVPGFESLDLANQSEPVRIPSDMLQVEGIDVFALMGDKAIGASIGEKHVNDLGAFINAKPRKDGTFLSVSYDMAKQMEIQEALTGQFQAMAEEEPTAVNEFAEAVEEAYRDMLGRSRVEMRLDGDGLHVDSGMTFK